MSRAIEKSYPRKRTVASLRAAALYGSPSMKENSHMARNYKTVLLVSDHQMDIQHLERKFMDIGSLDCKLCRCTLISAALQQLANKKLGIDIVIFDLRLKNAEAYENPYKVLKEASPGTPIIVMTGEEENELAEASDILKEGAAGHTHRDKFSALSGLINSALYSQPSK